MKKIISVLLSFVLFFSATTVVARAEPFVSLCSDNTGESYSVFSLVEACFQRAISVIARLFNRLTSVFGDELEKPSELEHSWIEADNSFMIESPEQELSAQTWVANELTFESQTVYSDAFNDVTLDLVLIGNGRKYTVPGFWDGGNTWKIRFVCPSSGDWYFYTVCSDKDNEQLNGRTGKVNCVEYTGEYDIYKKGFLTTGYGQKYLTYENGEPFFYLGDTHWGLGGETVDMVQTICERRKSQGFTVWQSEPLGAVFNLTNGVTDADMAAFADYDKKFELIASYGFVHANAEFFFTSSMESLIENFGGYSDREIQVDADGEIKKAYDVSDGVKAYLEKLSRYWVARYGSYPVIWTLAQESDNDFYGDDRGDHPNWNYINNPYKLVAEYIDKYDCYDHPLTAHQEYSGATSAYGSGKGASDKNKVYNKGAAPSAFRDVKAHTLYAAQWLPGKTEQVDDNVARDYWYNSQGKPAIMYESAYCGLMTKNYGARMQGWVAYLSGMYGYGWGAQDTWCYRNTYGEDSDSSDGVDTITAKEKQDATWETALEYESAYQCGYMADFLQSTQWYNLIPRFNNKAYFVPSLKVFYAYASTQNNDKIVIYFYSFNDSSVAEKPNAKGSAATSTGTVGNLERNQTYNYKWFDPITGEYIHSGSFVSTACGTWYAGQKPGTDMVLFIEKA